MYSKCITQIFCTVSCFIWRKSLTLTSSSPPPHPSSDTLCVVMIYSCHLSRTACPPFLSFCRCQLQEKEFEEVGSSCCFSSLRAGKLNYSNWQSCWVSIVVNSGLQDLMSDNLLNLVNNLSQEISAYL